MPTIAKVATASGGDINDIAKTAFALIDNLKVGPEQLEKALSGLVAAGKDGRFELKDMAQHFPALTAQAQTLGLTGTAGSSSLAAALQVAMKGAGSTGEA